MSEMKGCGGHAMEGTMQREMRLRGREREGRRLNAKVYGTSKEFEQER